MDDLEGVFVKASSYVRHNVGKLDQSQLLHLYGLYKVATVGLCQDPKPSFYNFEGCRKWKAWKSCTLSPEDSKLEYVKYVTLIDPTWIEVEDVTPKKETFGISVSKPIVPDAEVNDENGTIFDYVKEDKVDRVNELLEKNVTDVNLRDSEGMSLLHWACDRGNMTMVMLLLAKGADINAVDKDKQTPLHYAASCSHHEVTTELIRNHANVKIKDSEGQLAADVADSLEIKELLTG